jgi:hypothetical protein
MATNYSFPATSRYYGVETTTMDLPDGRKVTYLRRRLLPQPERFADLQQHVVREGDRLDNIAASYLGDAEAFWRIADANRAMQPEDLTRSIGRVLRITLPEGIPGPANA